MEENCLLPKAEDSSATNGHEHRTNGHESRINGHEARTNGRETLQEGAATTRQFLGYNSSQWCMLLGIGFDNFCIGLSVSIHAPFFPKEAEKRNTTSTEIGIILGTYSVVTFIVALLSGKLMQYIRPKYLMVTGAFIVGASHILFGTMSQVSEHTTFVYVCILLRIVEGIGAAINMTALYAITAVTFPEKALSAIGIMEAFLGMGLVVGPALGGVLYDLGGFGLPFYAIGVAFLFNDIIMSILLPSSAASIQNTGSNTKRFWLSPTIIMYSYVVFTTFYLIGFNIVSLEPHVRQFKLNGTETGLLFAAEGILYSVMSPFWGWLCDKKCNAKLLNAIGCTATVVALLFLGPLPILQLPEKLGYVILAIVMLGISESAKITPTFAACFENTVKRSFPDDVSTYGLVSSMFTSAQSVGIFVGESFGGYLLDKEGYNTSVSFVVVLEAICVLLLFSSVSKGVIKRWCLAVKNRGRSNEKDSLLANDTRIDVAYGK